MSINKILVPLVLILAVILTLKLAGVFGTSPPQTPQPETVVRIPADNLLPEILNIVVASVTETSAVIKWQTNKPTTSQIILRNSEGTRTQTEPGAVLATDHRLTLSNLKAGTTYHYTVLSKDAKGNEVTREGDVTTSRQMDLTPPTMTIDQAKQYTATIKTNYGDIKVHLFPKDAPLAVNNFVFLARQGFYDGVKFHRVMNGFVIQGGDPTDTGTGGPGYKFADEEVTKDYVAGTLAMANAGPNTNGSQFFITLANLSGKLPKNYTIFGLVTDGSDVVQKIANVPVKANSSGEASSPTVDVHIETITIEEK